MSLFQALGVIGVSWVIAMMIFVALFKKHANFVVRGIQEDMEDVQPMRYPAHFHRRD